MDRKIVPGVLVADITAQDIEDGQRGDCKRCPAALALTRALEEMGFTSDEVYITVGAHFAALHLEDVITTEQDQTGIVFYIMSYEMESWIDSFDSQYPVAPASFTLTREVTA